MQPLGSFLRKSISGLKADRALELHRLKAAWLEAVGPFIGSQTQPVKVKGDTLCLVVSSPVWAQEIKLQQRTILEKLRRSLPDIFLKNLVCWVGEPHAIIPAEEPDPEAPEESVPWKDLSIPQEREDKIEATLADLTDEGLKDKMRRLMRLSVQREIYLLNEGQLPCPMCGQLRPAEEPLCAPCRRERLDDIERKVMRLLNHKPWLSAKDIFEQTPLQDRATYLTIRKRLLGNLMLSAWQRTDGLSGQDLIDSMDPELRQLLLEITMLKCGLAPHQLQPKHFYYALGKRLADGYLAD